MSKDLHDSRTVISRIQRRVRNIAIKSSMNELEQGGLDETLLVCYYIVVEIYVS